MTEPRSYFSDHAHDLAAENTIDDVPQAYIDLLDRFIELVGKGRVLDAGCGHGKDVEYFIEHGLRAIGVDAAEGMVEYARKHKEGEYHRMDVRELSFQSSSFDGVWCNSVLQFLPPTEMEAALAELYRVLCPGGVFYTTFKLGDKPVVREDGEPTRYRVPDRTARKLLIQQGYSILDMQEAEVNGMQVMNVFCEKE